MSETHANRTYYRNEAVAFGVYALALAFFVGGIVWLAVNVPPRENLWSYYLIGGICAIISAIRAIQMLLRFLNSGATPPRSRPASRPRNKLPADHRAWSVRMAESGRKATASAKIDPDSPLARSWAEQERRRQLEEVRRKGLSHRHFRS